MNKSMKLAAGIAAIVVTLTGCANEVRTSSNEPLEAVSSQEHAKVYQGHENIPTITYVCAGEYGWATTPNASKDGRGQLVRFPEYDTVCGPQ